MTIVKNMRFQHKAKRVFLGFGEETMNMKAERGAIEEPTD
jgi:hypothetical protein